MLELIVLNFKRPITYLKLFAMFIKIAIKIITVINNNPDKTFLTLDNL